MQSKIAGRLKSYLTGDGQKQIVFYFSGPDAEGKRAAAESLCRILPAALIRADLKALVGDREEVEPPISRVLREGLLQPAAVYLENYDWLWENESKAGYHLPALRDLIRELGWVVFLSGKRPWPSAGLIED